MNISLYSYNYLTCASSSVAIKPGITYANNRTKSVQTEGVYVTERRQTLVDILMIKKKHRDSEKYISKIPQYTYQYIMLQQIYT